MDAKVTAPYRTAPRFGAVLTVLAIVALIAVLPRRYSLVPSWVVYTEMVIMILPMAIVQIIHGNSLVRRIERIAEYIAIFGALIFNAANLVVTTYYLVEHPKTLNPLSLFYTSVATWTANVLIFSLVYWLIDGGGPDARLNHEAPYPDFDFPGSAEDAPVPPNWTPGIVDYLFLGFTTSTAFSPTEAMPLTARAKVLVMIQSCISLVTIAIVAARTINLM